MHTDDDLYWMTQANNAMIAAHRNFPPRIAKWMRGELVAGHEMSMVRASPEWRAFVTEILESSNG